MCVTLEITGEAELVLCEDVDVFERITDLDISLVTDLEFTSDGKCSRIAGVIRADTSMHIHCLEYAWIFVITMFDHHFKGVMQYYKTITLCSSYSICITISISDVNYVHFRSIESVSVLCSKSSINSFSKVIIHSHY